MKIYIFITGGVVSSLGKGIASASLGALLESAGFKASRSVDQGVAELIKAMPLLKKSQFLNYLKQFLL